MQILVFVLYFGGEVLAYPSQLDIWNFYWYVGVLNLQREYLPYSGVHVSYHGLQCTSQILLICSDEYSVINIVGQCDVFRDVQSVQVMLDYIIAEGGRVIMVLGQDYKGLLLFISGECTLFLLSC